MKKFLTIAIVVMAGILLLGSAAFAQVTIRNTSSYTLNYNLSYRQTTANQKFNVYATTYTKNNNDNYTYSSYQEGEVGVMLNGGQAYSTSGSILKSLKPGQKVVFTETGSKNKTKYGINPMTLTFNYKNNTNVFFTKPLYFLNSKLNMASFNLTVFKGEAIIIQSTIKNNFTISNYYPAA